MEEHKWVQIIEDARDEMIAASTDREALVIAFTEIVRLILDLKYRKCPPDPKAAPPR